MPFYNNVDAARTTTADAVRDGLARQVSATVRWTDLVRTMVAEQRLASIVEVGPGNVLSGLVRRIDRTVNRLVVNDVPSLAAARATLDLLIPSQLHQPRAPVRLDHGAPFPRTPRLRSACHCPRRRCGRPARPPEVR